MKSDRVHLDEQIRQLRDLLDSLERSQQGQIGLQPKTLLHLMQTQSDDSESLHPHIMSCVYGHTDIDTVRRGLERLENDRADLDRDPVELTDPSKHSVDRAETTVGIEDSMEKDLTDTKTSDDTQADEMRAENQRSLWDYKNRNE